MKNRTKKLAIGQFAEALSTAWRKYHEFFGEVPHGTPGQMATMIELMPDKRFLEGPNLLEAAKKAWEAERQCYPTKRRSESLAMLHAAIAKAEEK